MGINATKWLATHPVASRRANTLTNRAWDEPDATRPSRPCFVMGAGRCRPVTGTFDQATDFLPRVFARDRPTPMSVALRPAKPLCLTVLAGSKDNAARGV